MISNLAPPVALAELPLEVLHMIVDHLEKRDLKQFRNSCKLLDDLCKPSLFKDCIVFPHTTCFEDKISVLESGTIAQYVRRISYSYAWLPILHHLKGLHAEGESQQVPMIDSIDWILRERLWTAFDDLSNDVAELFLLQRLISLMPNLETFELVGNAGESYVYNNGRPCSFYQNLLQALARADAEESTTSVIEGRLHIESADYDDYNGGCAPNGRLVMLALGAARKAIRLEVRCCDLMNFVGREDEFMPTKLMGSSLVKIRELIFDSQFESSKDVGFDVPSELGALLSKMTALESFDMDFLPVMGGCGFCPIKDQSISLSRMITPYPSHDRIDFFTTQKLHHLALCTFCCYEAEIYDMFNQVSQSLSSLCLEDFTLLPRRADGPKPCLVRLVKFWHSELNLCSIDLWGTFNNTGKQEWTISDMYRGGEGTLWCRVKDYILRRVDKCPLESEAIMEGHEDLQKPNSSGISDGSFEIYGDNGDSDTDEDGEVSRSQEEQEDATRLTDNGEEANG